MYQEQFNLSSKDILEKEFKIDTRGYRLKEVDQYLDLIISDYETFFKILSEKDKEKAGLQEATSNVYGNGHTSLFADMIAAIENDRKPYVDAVAGRNALEMVLAIYKSQLTAQPVKLPLKEFASVEMIGMFGEGSL